MLSKSSSKAGPFVKRGNCIEFRVPCFINVILSIAPIHDANTDCASFLIVLFDEEHSAINTSAILIKYHFIARM
jgi:hypothetical protein